MRRDAELKKAQDDAAAARAEVQQARQTPVAAPGSGAINTLVVPATVPAGSALVTIPPNDKDASGKPIYNANKPNGRFNLGGVTVTLGGFVDLTGYYRSRNQNAGATSSLKALPFDGPTPQGNSAELGMTAQQTRLSVRADGAINANSTITGYVEADFNNGAGTANSVQSNSYTPRLRQAFADYDDAPWQTYGVARLHA